MYPSRFYILFTLLYNLQQSQLFRLGHPISGKRFGGLNEEYVAFRGDYPQSVLDCLL